MKKTNDLYREMKVLKKYYDVDVENKVVTIPFKFEKASDIIDDMVIVKDDFIIKEDVIKAIEDKVMSIPISYRVKIELQINDYEGIDPKKLLTNFNDVIELNRYNQVRERKLNKFVATFLLVLGISIIIVNTTAKTAGWYHDIAFEILDIVSWVFIWEATTIAFLTSSEIVINSNKLVKRVASLALKDSSGTILVSEDSFDDAKEWDNTTKAESVGRFFLLFSGAALIATAVLAIVNSFGTVQLLWSEDEEIKALLAEGNSFLSLLILVIIELVVYLLCLFAGISALTTYLGRGPFRGKIKYFFLVVMGLLFALEAYGFFITKLDKSSFLSELLITFAGLFYVVGTIIIIRIEYKKKKLIMKEMEE